MSSVEVATKPAKNNRSSTTDPSLKKKLLQALDEKCRNYELPRPLPLGEMIDVYTTIWYGSDDDSVV